jgi:hypothetical protein
MRRRQSRVGLQACWLVRDPEGVIQNHFIRAPPRHLFVRYLLHVMLANALAVSRVPRPAPRAPRPAPRVPRPAPRVSARSCGVAAAAQELHVVQATGPCAYAAAFLNAFGPGPPPPSLVQRAHVSPADPEC